MREILEPLIVTYTGSGHQIRSRSLLAAIQVGERHLRDASRRGQRGHIGYHISICPEWAEVHPEKVEDLQDEVDHANGDCDPYMCGLGDHPA